MAIQTETCCPPFHPKVWNDKHISWQDKLFVKDRVWSFLHMPLNYGKVLQRNLPRIKAAGALPDEMLVLSDENSLWGADLYIAVNHPVPDARMAKLSGTFLTRVFEGPYKNIRLWIEEMHRHVQSKCRRIESLFFFYTTCPKCAKKYGKNYVVLLARVDDAGAP